MPLTPIILGFISIMLPGFFLSLALLRKTKLSLFEITVIGFILGLVFPPAFTWGESYLMGYIHFFSFSEALYNINVVILTIIGVALSIQQGALSPAMLRGLVEQRTGTRVRDTAAQNYRDRLSSTRDTARNLGADVKIIRLHEKAEADLSGRHQQEISLLKSKGAGEEELSRVSESHLSEEKRLFSQHESEERSLISSSEKSTGPFNKMTLVWSILLLLMLLAFASRIINIGVAPKFFEFDPYYDMMATKYILTYGYQINFDHSAWPTLINGVNRRIEPIVPYIEAYWYQLASNGGSQSINNTLLSTVSSFYPPITAALLVFVIFLFLYHEYGEFPALVGAAIATVMPVLISTFIAGEQLLEPWGLFTIFFFIAAYLLAVKEPKEYRYAILAGIAFVSTFLGAHYYTVDAGLISGYILVQGVINVFRKVTSKEDMLPFYKMNLVVIAIIAIGYAIYYAYGASLASRIPSLLGIPVVVSFPIAALAFVALFEFLPIYCAKYGIFRRIDLQSYLLTLAALSVFAILLIMFTPIGKPVKSYLALSQKFTTPSSALFMTVQEYVPTGPNYNFGAAGIGLIGASILGVSIIIWMVLIAFAIFAVLSIIYNNSKSSVLSGIVVAVLTLAGMSEIKYMPHMAVAYVLAFSIVVAELYSLVKRSDKALAYIFAGVVCIVVIAEAWPFINVFIASGQSCTSIAKAGNSVGYGMFCNVVTPQWLNATAWMSNNIGPYAPRILSWWDYGDWINWFGNSNAVIRGDNAVATYDEAVAEQYVLGPNDSYGPASLAKFMTSAQAGYVLFDDQLVPKWGALDFLACVGVNQTSRAFASSQGKLYGSDFVLGTSQCEINHSPMDIGVPTSPSLSDYCQFSNSSITAVKSLATIGETVSQQLNTTYCVGTSLSKNGTYLQVYYLNGTKANIILPTAYYLGNAKDQLGNSYAEFMALYLPNGPNDTVTNAPTRFYDSNYYRGFFFGKLSGYTLVYPKNFTGINFVNNTAQTVMIYKLNNYTGGNPPVNPKPSWIKNSYSIPG